MGFVKDAWDGITGKTGAKAAEKAGNLQADSSKYAADLAQKQYEQTRQDQMPWLNMGNAALQQLGAFTGVSPQASGGQQQQALTQTQQQIPAQPQPQQQAQNSQLSGGHTNSLTADLIKRGVINTGPLNKFFTGGWNKDKVTANTSSPNIANTAEPAPAPTPNAAQSTDNQQGAATGGMPQYEDKWGDRMESAYVDGKLTGGLDPNNFETDPSYQFRKQQGMDGIESSAAAAGGLLSGAALKSLNRYNSDLASQEYGNAWSRDQAEKNNLYNTLSGNRSQDYNLWSGERTRQYNELANLAGVGQQTATQLGQFGAQNAATQGNLAINGANAQANGLIGAASSKTQGINNLIGLGMKAGGMFI